MTRERFSATRFITDSRYRETEGLPALRAEFARAWRGMATETRESFRAVGHLAAVANGRTLTDAERGELKLQLQDLAKAVPMLAVFLLPGGMLLLPLLCKILPFDLTLSGFRDAPEPVVDRRETPDEQEPRSRSE
ncbi:MAG: hypothetical protein KDC38_20170 [Planctomycetes bacterium]|nr:hypothetical protein [Planctomycetota bacterium]